MNGKYLFNLLASQRLRLRKLKLLPVVEKASVAVRAESVEILLVVGAGAVVVVVGEVVEAATYVSLILLLH